MSDAEYIELLERLIPWAKAQASQAANYHEHIGAAVPYRGGVVPLTKAGAQKVLETIRSIEEKAA